ncbi:MAG: hypothetical protein J6Y41_00915 [Bacteroidaceae bacterium]|nr:hypothetical protein [Bacteroidaceae bacterium]
MEDNAEKNASQKETSITKNECLLNEIYNESNDAGSLGRINSTLAIEILLYVIFLLQAKQKLQ